MVYTSRYHIILLKLKKENYQAQPFFELIFTSCGPSDKQQAAVYLHSKGAVSHLDAVALWLQSMVREVDVPPKSNTSVSIKCRVKAGSHRKDYERIQLKTDLRLVKIRKPFHICLKNIFLHFL